MKSMGRIKISVGQLKKMLPEERREILVKLTPDERLELELWGDIIIPEIKLKHLEKVDIGAIEREWGAIPESEKIRTKLSFAGWLQNRYGRSFAHQILRRLELAEWRREKEFGKHGYI